ncbi:hypothetical protein [Rhodoligotrophos defluvii]|uniref:hypothetical protein n=1 Tax=Rhodoligotrophos defluvii TaxID=2561934 RepID=UPI0010C97159|nr:hypothetical protein [Rhodoligotrophos defluvii]
MASAIQPKEPPQPLNHFFVGQDNRGCWTVRDERNLVGGCFVSKDAAIHFARQETNNATGAVICMAESQRLSLDPLFGRRAAA